MWVESGRLALQVPVSHGWLTSVPEYVVIKPRWILVVSLNYAEPLEMRWNEETQERQNEKRTGLPKSIEGITPVSPSRSVRGPSDRARERLRRS